MQNTLHPIYDCLQEASLRGVIIYKRHDELLICNDTFVYSGLIVCLNIKGTFICEYDMTEIVFQEHDIVVLQPNHIISLTDVSADACAMMVMISPAVLKDMKYDNPLGYRDAMHYHRNCCFHLTDSQFENIADLLNLMFDINKSDRTSRLEIIKSMTETLFLMLKDFRIENCVEENAPAQHEMLFAQFCNEVAIHYRESREVRYYAEKLCLSPRYFSAIIKQYTGIRPIEWINRYVVLQAKIMLRKNCNMSVLQISENLGFPDSSGFSRLFKQMTGMSPTDFRTSTG